MKGPRAVERRVTVGQDSEVDKGRIGICVFSVSISSLMSGTFVLLRLKPPPTPQHGG